MWNIITRSDFDFEYQYNIKNLKQKIFFKRIHLNIFINL